MGGWVGGMGSLGIDFIFIFDGGRGRFRGGRNLSAIGLLFVPSVNVLRSI